jgi:hypothetical protein
MTAAPHVPHMADMVPRCHRMAAVRGGDHMRRYVKPGNTEQGGEEKLASPFFRSFGSEILGFFLLSGSGSCTAVLKMRQGAAAGHLQLCTAVYEYLYSCHRY